MVAEKKRICSACENYKYGSSVGPIEGYCLAFPGEEENTYKEVRFNTDASKCLKFKEAEELIISDGMEAIYHPNVRLYGEIEEK